MKFQIKVSGNEQWCFSDEDFKKKQPLGAEENTAEYQDYWQQV